MLRPCSTSVWEERWYLALCRIAYPCGCSSAALSLGPRNPTSVSVACTDPLVCCQWGRNTHVWAARSQAHALCSRDVRANIQAHKSARKLPPHNEVGFQRPIFHALGVSFCLCYSLGKVSCSSGGFTGFNDCVSEEQLQKLPGAHHALGPHPH